jgi:hypothetical protein
MRDIVNQYCPDRHVFELMFDPEKVIHCEEIVRKAIAKNSTQIYYDYDLRISGPFRDIIIEDWIELEKAQASSESTADIVASQSQHKLVIINYIYDIE